MNAIKISDWMAVHPYKTPKSVDYTYLKIANRLYECWRFSLLGTEFNDEVRMMSGIVVAAYFEDVISYTNLWGTFIRKHKEMYGKYLPFYDTSETAPYYDDEINLQDVFFLLWSTIQKVSEDVFVNPENPGIADLARRMYKILDEEFEEMPVNEYFLDYIQNEEHYKDFFSFKIIADWLYYNSFLFGFENSYLLQTYLESAEHNSSISLNQLEYSTRSESLFAKKTGPLALPLKEWYAGMIEGMLMEKEIAIINAIENHESDYFRLLRMDETYFYVVDTKEREFSVLRSSFEHLRNKTLQCKVLIAALVKYDGEWHANGVSVWTDEESVYWDLMEKNKTGARAKEIIYEKVLKNNNGSPIAYFKNKSELEAWIGKLVDTHQSMRSDALDSVDNIVAFASPGKDISVVPDIGWYIKDPKNPFYNSKEAGDTGVALLVNNFPFSSDIYHYLYENNMLPNMYINSLYGKKRGCELVQDNVDFIARFFRWNNY